MVTGMTTEKSAGTLADRAMLVRLTIKQWTARRLDRKVTREVNTSRGAAADAGNYHKALVAKEALQTIRQLAGEIRHWHYDNTLPWADDGARLLPANHFAAYSAKVREYQTVWDDTVSDFVTGYPAFVEASRTRLNGMFDQAEYPSLADIRKRYGLDLVIDPVPAAGDWRIELGDEYTARIKRQIESRVTQATHEAMADLWDRLYEVVAHIADRLTVPDAIFRDSLIGNAQELCGLLTTLNITSDPNLEAMRRTVQEQLASRKPAELRTNPAEREETADKARQIMSAMGAYMGAGSQEVTQ